MSEGIDNFLNLDIPEKLNLSRNIQTMWARGLVSGASPDESAKAILAVVVGGVMELEERLLAVEKKLADRKAGSGSAAGSSCGCVPGHGVPGCDLHGPTGPSEIW